MMSLFAIHINFGNDTMLLFEVAMSFSKCSSGITHVVELKFLVIRGNGFREFILIFRSKPMFGYSNALAIIRRLGICNYIVTLVLQLYICCCFDMSYFDD